MQMDCVENKQKQQTPAQIFACVIKQLICDGSYDAVAKLFTKDVNAERNCDFLKEIHEELMQDVCRKYLNERTYKENLTLYNCADEILKLMAKHAPSDGLLIELLEMTEELKQDYQFTTVLRALQMLLLNCGDDKSKSYDWALNSVFASVEQLKLPELLTTGYDDEQAQLLEQDKLIEELLSRLITIELFYEPLRVDILKKPRHATVFRYCGLKSRRNLLLCFLVQLLAKPLALLDLTVADGRKTNSYTLQIVRKLTTDIAALIVDPYYFLTVVEQQARWQRRLDSSKGVYELSSKNIFLTPERLPLIGLGIFYYMLFLDKQMVKLLALAPKVYSATFIVESTFYLVNMLITADEPALQLRGLLLALEVLTQFMADNKIPAVALELSVHRSFCARLAFIAGYAAQVELRQHSVSLLKKYILYYDDEGRYLILRQLVQTVSHMGLKSFLINLYKDIVAAALQRCAPNETLPAYYSGLHFREMLLQHICQLPKGVETDLLEHAEMISAALNIVRFFLRADADNRTGFWDLQQDIEKNFIEPLRVGLDYSIAHYKLEKKQVEEQWNEKKALEKHHRAMELLDLAINNDDVGSLEKPAALDREKKLEFLNQNLLTFDLLKSLWARIAELMEQTLKRRIVVES